MKMASPLHKGGLQGGYGTNPGSRHCRCEAKLTPAQRAIPAVQLREPLGRSCARFLRKASQVFSPLRRRGFSDELSIEEHAGAKS